VNRNVDPVTVVDRKDSWEEYDKNEVKQKQKQNKNSDSDSNKKKKKKKKKSSSDWWYTNIYNE